jgi:GH18 family chitinase
LVDGHTPSQVHIYVLAPKEPVSYLPLGHFAFVTNAAARATFVSNAVKMIEDYGFDGM